MFEFDGVRRAHCERDLYSWKVDFFEAEVPQVEEPIDVRHHREIVKSSQTSLLKYNSF